MPDASDRPLAGKVALVTGAARNIGRAIALALSDEGAGVVVNARAAREDADAVAAEVEARGVPALAHLADVTDEAAVAGMVEAAVDRMGRLDILVNNAAIRRLVPLGEMSLAEWRAVCAVALEGTFLCCRAALPHLAAAGAGAIVNIGGLTAHTGARNRAHVVASKAGVVGLTRALAVELADDGITANCVVPGNVETRRGASAGPPPALPGNLAGRPGRPDEIAAMVAHLCGPRGRYLTGQVIHVNGGSYLP